MRLVVGLGNPGTRYALTRHNVAWRVLDEVERRWPGEDNSLPDVYAARRTKVHRQVVELMRPLTYMNLAGQALERWMHEYESDGGYEDLLVVSDDVYLPVGSLRLRASGSSGGHRGLESIEAVLGGRGFARLRLGVGAAADAAELREHVLEGFSQDEEPVVADAVTRAADAVECWIAEGITAAMNRFNRRNSQEVSES